MAELVPESKGSVIHPFIIIIINILFNACLVILDWMLEILMFFFTKL